MSVVENRLRFAVVGCGRMGVRRATSIQKNPGAQLVCVADTDREKAAATASRLGCGQQTLDDILERTDIDCAVVSTPNRQHAEAVIPLLTRGKHVFCEKPLSPTPEDGEAMVRAAIAAGKSLKVGSNLRHFPSVTRAKEILSQGTLGRILFARGWIGHEGWNLRDSWYGDAAMIGGGTLLDNGCHLFDLTRWMLGEVEDCTAVIATRQWAVEPLEDNGMAILRTTDGVPVFIQASWTERRGYMYLEIHGTGGILEIDNRNPACATVLVNASNERITYDFSQVPARSYDDEMAAFVNAIAENRAPEPSGWDGLRAVQLAWAAYESSRTGTRVATFGPAEQALSALVLTSSSRLSSVALA